MWVKFLDYQFPVKKMPTYWSVESAPYAKLTVTINCEQRAILWRVDELHFVSNPTDTAFFFFFCGKFRNNFWHQWSREVRPLLKLLISTPLKIILSALCPLMAVQWIYHHERNWRWAVHRPPCQCWLFRSREHMAGNQHHGLVDSRKQAINTNLTKCLDLEPEVRHFFFFLQ